MNGRVESRFEIVHPEHGLIDTETTLMKALDRARSVLNRPTWSEVDFIMVYDSMARVGSNQLFRIEREDNDYHRVTKIEQRTE